MNYFCFLFMQMTQSNGYFYKYLSHTNKKQGCVSRSESKLYFQRIVFECGKQ